MKAPPHTLTVVFVIALASCLTSVVSAQADRTSTTRSQTTTSPAAANTATDLTRNIYIASIDADKHGLRYYDGQKLFNTQGAEIGTIKDLIVHPQSSQVRYLVVSSGGVGGMGNSLRLVPVETVRRSDRELEVDILQAAWLQVPPVSDENYVIDRFDISPTQHDMMVQQFGGASRSSRPVTATTPANAGPQPVVSGLLRASALRGKDIRAGNQAVGEIENVIVDLERGTAAALVDVEGSFTGTSAKYIVPLNRLAIDNARQDPIGTTLTRADFDRAQPGNFATLGRIAAREMRTTDEQPLTPTGRATTSDLSNRASTAAATAANQVSDTLAASARAVQNAISEDPSFVGERVQVTTANGRIVLSGSVRNEATRNRIEDAARRVVTAGNIDNRITVENR